MIDRHTEIEYLKKEKFDLLIIGGGATGAGVALDAVTRGLRVALVEKYDFAHGTSSRSTKLVHGGVRYLEQAVMGLDRSQFRLVRDALRERKTLIEIAPHLVRWLPLLVPMYKRFEAAYYNAGLRLYDWLAGKSLVHRSRFVSPKEAVGLCPHLKRSGLKGGVIYYDGQFDDSRMALSILLRARELGAVIINYMEVTGFKKTSGMITGVHLKDGLSGMEFTTKAAAVVNAAGPMVDTLLQMDDPKATPILKASSGTHLVLKRQAQETKVGVLIPKTRDKRVLFVLPWLGHTLVGTTDDPAPISEDPKPSKQDIEFILQEFDRYFEPKPTEKDILSSWCGLRPLVNDSAGKTAKISRDHHLSQSESGLVTICGGKWTTYRLMAEDTVDYIVKNFDFNVGPCLTRKTKLYGGENFSPEIIPRLTRDLKLPEDCAHHLARSYGDRAIEIAELAKTETHLSQRLVKNHPFIEAEVQYVIEEEMAFSTADVLFRRIRLAFLDKSATALAQPRVSEILAKHFKWDAAQVQKYLQTFPSNLRNFYFQRIILKHAPWKRIDFSL